MARPLVESVVLGRGERPPPSRDVISSDETPVNLRDGAALRRNRSDHEADAFDFFESLDLFNVLNFIDRDWGLYKQVSEFEDGPRFLNATGFDALNNRPTYRFAPPTIIETTVYGENPSGAQSGINRLRWTMQLGVRLYLLTML